MKEINMDIVKDLIALYFGMIPELVVAFIIVAFISWAFWYLVKFFMGSTAVR